MRRLPKRMHFGFKGATLFYNTAVRPGACMFAEGVPMSFPRTFSMRSPIGSRSESSPFEVFLAPGRATLGTAWVPDAPNVSSLCPLSSLWEGPEQNLCVWDPHFKSHHGSRFTYHMSMKFWNLHPLYHVFPSIVMWHVATWVSRYMNLRHVGVIWLEFSCSPNLYRFQFSLSWTCVASANLRWSINKN